jgi:hypothetical protein
MTEDKFMFKWDVCRMEYPHGPHKYEGHRLRLYGDKFCCDSCGDANWDGWAPHHEEVLLKYLTEKDLPVPKRTAKGLLPRD